MRLVAYLFWLNIVYAKKLTLSSWSNFSMILLLKDELRDAVLLVFANKQDLPNAMNAAEITDKLGLHSLRQRHWYVLAFL